MLFLNLFATRLQIKKLYLCSVKTDKEYCMEKAV